MFTYLDHMVIIIRTNKLLYIPSFSKLDGVVVVL